MDLSSHVKTVVIPVAGLGTRMLPATKAIPKEMLILGNKPLIQFIVEEAIFAGFRRIIFVTHSSKSAIENHFDSAFELESTLSVREKNALLRSITNIIPDDVQIESVRQGRALGLGHAVLMARKAVGDNDFAVMLPDVLIDQYSSDLSKENLAEMVSTFERTGISQIMVEQVPAEMVDQYGVVDMEGALPKPGETASIAALVEKPDVDCAPSNYAIVGRYIFSRKIWPFLENARPGKQGEIQLTDAISAMLQDGNNVSAYSIRGKSLDCGSHSGYAKAFLHTVFHDVNIGDDVRRAARSLLRSFN